MPNPDQARAPADTPDESRPTIGISSCLLGNEVRFDGGHKHSRYITSTLGEHLDFESWCPEVAIGLGTPRKPIHLISQHDTIRVVETGRPEHDVTGALHDYGREASATMGHLAGYIFKKDSPSCGMERVKVRSDGMPSRTGVGAFAEEVMAAHPTLPTEEEGRLMDAGLRTNFIGRVFTRHRWQQTTAGGLTAAKLVDFHTRHKFFVLAHNEAVYRQLGQIVAEAGRGDIQALGSSYFTLLMRGLRTLATPARHANVLMHIFGFFKDHLEAGDKAELLELIDQHRNRLVPLIVPITLINHYLRKFETPYIERQVYLEPHPRELLLMNS